MSNSKNAGSWCSRIFCCSSKNEVKNVHKVDYKSILRKYSENLLLNFKNTLPDITSTLRKVIARSDLGNGNLIDIIKIDKDSEWEVVEEKDGLYFQCDDTHVGMPVKLRADDVIHLIALSMLNNAYEKNENREVRQISFKMMDGRFYDEGIMGKNITIDVTDPKFGSVCTYRLNQSIMTDIANLPQESLWQKLEAIVSQVMGGGKSLNFGSINNVPSFSLSSSQSSGVRM